MALFHVVTLQRLQRQAKPNRKTKPKVQKMAATNVTFKGKTFTTNAIKGAATRNANHLAEREEFLNVATLQVALHGNTEWLNILFESADCRLKNGKLNKAAKEELSYVQAHCPLVQWDTKANKVGKRKTKDNSPLNGKLSVPFTEDAQGNKTLVDAIESAGFAYSLAEWRDLKDAQDDKPSAPSNKKAATLASQLETMAALLLGDKDAKVTGKAAEFDALAAIAERVQDAALAAKQAAQDVESAKLAEVETAVLEAVTTEEASPNERKADTDRAKHNETAPEMKKRA